MKVQSVQIQNVSKLSKRNKQNNTFQHSVNKVQIDKSQVSFGGIGAMVLFAQALGAKAGAKGVLIKGEAAKSDSYKTLDEAKELQREATKIKNRANEMFLEAREIVENTDFDLTRYEYSYSGTDWERREYKIERGRKVITEFDDEDCEIRKIIVGDYITKIFHFDTSELKHNVYKFNSKNGHLLRFGYDASDCDYDDEDYKAKKDFIFDRQTEELTTVSFKYKLKSRKKEKADKIYEFDIDGRLKDYREKTETDFDGNERAEKICKFDENGLASCMLNYINVEGRRDSFGEYFEFDEYGKLGEYYQEGKIDNGQIESAYEKYGFEDGKLSEIFRHWSQIGDYIASFKAYFYNNGNVKECYEMYEKRPDYGTLYTKKY